MLADFSAAAHNELKLGKKTVIRSNLLWIMHPTIPSWVRYPKEIALANQITLFSEFLAHIVMPKNGKRMSPWKECVWSANRLFFMPKYFFFKKLAQNLEIIVVDSRDWHTYVLHIWSKSSDPLKSRKKMCVFFKYITPNDRRYTKWFW